MIPIWKETNYIVDANNSPFTYSIEVLNGVVEVNGKTQDNWETIFNGKAWVRPDADEITINLNKICQNYLEVNYTPQAGVVKEDGKVKQFRLLNENGVVLDSYRFFWDWSFKEDTYTPPFGLNHPINGKTIQGVYIFKSSYGRDNVITTFGTKSPNALPELYKEVDGCGVKYALYYLNRYGGWDTFIFEGNVNKTDTYDRKYVKDKFKNPFINDITTSYQLHTGWLNDEQSERCVFNLLSSNHIYLHDLIKDEIVKVYITDTEGKYKTFKNNNNKLINYTIMVSQSENTYNL